MKSSKEIIPQLDFLRFLAIMLVVVFHATLILHPNYSHHNYDTGILQYTGVFDFILKTSLFANGWVGVQLFLVLSGFLIHKNYLGKLDYISYFNKRFFRIYPTYILAFGFFYFVKYGESNLNNGISHVLLIQNLNQTKIFQYNPSFWSLALEAQCYLLYPVIAYLVRKNINIVVLAFLFLICSFFPNLSLLHFDLSNFLRYYWIWLLGAALAQYFDKLKEIRMRCILIAGVLSYLAFVLAIYFQILSKFSVLSISIFFGSLILLLYKSAIWDFINRVIGSSLINKMNYIGLISYSLYLIHQPYLANLLKEFRTNFKYTWLNESIALASSLFVLVLISYGLYHFVEKNSIRMGNHLLKKVRSFNQK